MKASSQPLHRQGRGGAIWATSRAIIPSIEGSAISTGFNTIWIDQADQFWRGFQVI
jgi:proline racemase